MLKTRIKLIQNPVYVPLYRKILFFVTLFTCLALSFAFVIQPRSEPKGFTHGQEDAGSFLADEASYAVLHKDGTVSIHFEGEGFRVSFEAYTEMFDDLPLYNEDDEKK